jgi:hypothetical protein
MNSNIELPSGKIFNLDRFVALLPDNTTGDLKYSLILEGYSHNIKLTQTEADLIKQELKLKSYSHKYDVWDREEQIRKNQPKLKLLKEWIDKTKNRQSTPESIAAFEEFKKTIDAERPAGQKLYEN